jgi:hypothetical protein
VAKHEEIEKVVSSSHDKWGMEYVAPGHCTGEPTFVALKRALGDRYLYAGLGTIIALGGHATPTRRIGSECSNAQESKRTWDTNQPSLNNCLTSAN